MAEDLSALVTALSGLVSTLQNQQTSTASVQEVLQTQAITFDGFDESVENFESYSQRLENFFKLRGLHKNDKETSDAKVMVLINCLGSRHYKLLASLTSPELPATKTYQELMDLLRNHLAPKKNVLAEQHKFFSRVQQPGESISTFVAGLKELIKNCEFKTECKEKEPPCFTCSKSVIDMLLRAQFIRGLQDSSIRERILQLVNVSFDKALETALAIEASRIQNREVYNNSSHASNNVHKIGFTKGQSASKYNQNRSSRQKSSKITGRSINLQELGLSGLCLHCGKKNHQTDNCRIKEKLHCNFCRKKGHTNKVCMSTLLQKKSTNCQKRRHRFKFLC